MQGKGIQAMASKKNTTGHGLTAKQEAFCQAYVKGDSKGNASAAYRAAYDTDKMKPASIRAEACRLLDNLNVTQRIDQLNADIVQQHRLQGSAFASVSQMDCWQRLRRLKAQPQGSGHGN